MRRLTLLSLITLGLLLFPISVSASFAPADRETFSCVTDVSCPGPTFITFNSFLDAPSPDAPAGGDERAFFEVKDASSTSVNEGFSDSLAVRDGQRIMMRVFIHNNANPSLMGIENAKAKNTSVMVQLPSNLDTSNTPVAYITADNATPRQISDTISLSGTGSFSLTFDQSSVNITDRSNEGNGDFVTHAAGTLDFKDSSNLRVELGDWPGGFKRHGSLTFTAVVHSNNTTTTTATQTCSALDVNGIDRSRATFTAHSASGVSATGYSFTVKDPSGNTVDSSTVNTNATTAVYNFNQSNPGTYTISAVTNTAGVTNNTACVRQITVQSAPVTLAASTTTTTPATTTLPNTGVGDALGVFTGASVLGTAGHYALRRYRQN
jgi:hypothetical protein